MRICIEKSTGKLIESQSGGRTHPTPEVDDKKYAQANLDVLIQNAVNAGYTEEDVEVKFVSDEEFQAIMDAIPLPEPNEEEIYEAKIQSKIREIAIREIEAEK